MRSTADTTWRSAAQEGASTRTGRVASLLAVGLLLTSCGTPDGASVPAHVDAASEGSDDAAQPGDTERPDRPGPDPAAEADRDPDPDPPSSSGAQAAAVDGELVVHYLDVGQGDATLLLHEDASILIDTGRWQATDVVPMLAARGVDALDLVIVTHPHADHIGQFDQVMDGVEVAEVWWSGSETTSQTFERALSALERSDASYEEPRAGDTTSIGPMLVEVVNPPTGVNLTDLHDAGLAMRITYGDVRFLFTGDAERATEARMVAGAASTLGADILQLGHHGSDTSTTSGFLEAVDPSVAIYSAGGSNQYGHPHGSVIQRLADAGMAVYGTDVHGSIAVSTNGRTWSVSTSHDGEVVAGSARKDRTTIAGSGDGEGDTGDGSDAGTPPAATSTGGCAPGQVDINVAGFEDLQDIIHIGPARAQDLPGFRPYSSVRQLDRISGIGPARLDDIVAEGVACVG